MTFRRMSAAAVATALLATGLGSAASSAPAPDQAIPGSDGMGDSYFPKDGNGGYNVSHYDIHDTYRIAERRLSGYTTVTARATQTLTRFNLDLVLPVSEVRVNGNKARFTKPNTHELVVTPYWKIPVGKTFKVRVVYAGSPAATAWDKEKPFLASKTEAMAMNEPHIAPWWFPANDHPRDKAAFDINVKVPKGQQLVANGSFRGTKTAGNWTTWHWRAREPMAPYLAFFAAGRFQVTRGTTNGLPWTNAVSLGLGSGDRNRASTMLKRTPAVVKWLSSHLGPYPFSTTGGVVTSLDAGFALENQTRPTYGFIGGADLVVHEQAHQWFGDDVAVENWRDIWLNEGFATFMEVRYAEYAHGRDGQEWLLDQWGATPAGDSFWDLKIGNPGKNNIFRGEIYDRGAMTVQALRHRVGETDFRNILRTWVRDRSRGNGSITQFKALAESISGEDLDGFFTAWLNTSARPAKTAANGLL